MMTPTWQTDDGSIRLYHADCLAVLPELGDGEADIAVTSPPYNTLPTSHKPSGLHGQRKSGVNKWIAKAVAGYADTRPEGQYQAWIAYVVGECARACKGLVWVNHKVRYRDKTAVHPVRFIPFPIYAEVIWDRRGSMALNCKRYAPSHEALWAFGDTHYWDDEQNKLLSVWTLPPDRGDDAHPCAYPVEIAERPIRSSCPPGGVVIDPFMGSGTTAVACIRSGRQFVGIEKDIRFFEMSVNRIELELSKPRKIPA